MHNVLSQFQPKHLSQIVVDVGVVVVDVGVVVVDVGVVVVDGTFTNSLLTVNSIRN